MIYILEFNRPFHHARYYVGYADDYSHYQKRVKQHRSGTGAKIMAAVVKAGIEFKTACLLEGDRHRERAIKRMKATPRFVARVRRGKVKGIIVCLF